MILSYQNIFKPSAKRTRVEATVTTDHNASSYGQPVIVFEDGEALNFFSWVGMGYQVVEATEQERAGLRKMGLM